MSNSIVLYGRHPVAPRARRKRARERRQLRAQDRRSAALAELHSIDTVLAGAARTIAADWVQHGWFAWDEPTGQRHRVTEHNLSDLTGQDVSAACLVGAIVHAAGGPAAASTQLVHRTLGLTWHALYRAAEARIDWSPPPAIRASRIRDLAAWNDRPERRRSEVATLLHHARAIAQQELGTACNARPQPMSVSGALPPAEGDCLCAASIA
jgi:hypothetical protein